MSNVVAIVLPIFGQIAIAAILILFVAFMLLICGMLVMEIFKKWIPDKLTHNLENFTVGVWNLLGMVTAVSFVILVVGLYIIGGSPASAFSCLVG